MIRILMRNWLKPALVIILGFYPLFYFDLVFALDFTKLREKTIVTKVIDGDSLEVRYNGTLKTIRLYGIDSPEWKQPFSRKARSYLKKLLLGMRFNLKHYMMINTAEVWRWFIIVEIM
jgi:endonuclease YncB( thermonuclease family)